MLPVTVPLFFYHSHCVFLRLASLQLGFLLSVFLSIQKTTKLAIDMVSITETALQESQQLFLQYRREGGLLGMTPLVAVSGLKQKNQTDKI